MGEGRAIGSSGWYSLLAPPPLPLSILHLTFVHLPRNPRKVFTFEFDLSEKVHEYKPNTGADPGFLYMERGTIHFWRIFWLAPPQNEKLDIVPKCLLGWIFLMG